MRAFTLIELVFVLVIIGILTGIGMSSFKPKYLIDDVNFIHAKIKEAQFLGIGYEHLDFDGTGGKSPDYNAGCIKIEKDFLEKNATKENEVNYKFHVEDFDYGIICFDSKGRPHKDNFLTVPIKVKETYTFTYGTKERNITIEARTGYSRIEYPKP